MSKAHVITKRLPGAAPKEGQTFTPADGQGNREQRRAQMKHWPRQHRLHFAGFGRYRRHWYVRKEVWS